MKVVVAAGALGLALALGPGLAGAGTVVGIPSVSGPITSLSYTIASPHPNQTDPGNRIHVRESITRLDPVDLVFAVRDSGGTTGYLAELRLTNHSFETWTGFSVQLGSGRGASFVAGGGPVALPGSWQSFETRAVTLPIQVPDGAPGVAPRLGFLTLRGQAVVSKPGPVPEPHAALLFAAGALVVARALSRRS